MVGVRFPSVCAVDDCDNTGGVTVEFSEVTKGNVSGIPRELRVYKEFSPIFSRLPALPIINSTFCLSYPTDSSSSSSSPSLFWLSHSDKGEFQIKARHDSHQPCHSTSHHFPATCHCRIFSHQALGHQDDKGKHHSSLQPPSHSQACNLVVIIFGATSHAIGGYPNDNFRRFEIGRCDRCCSPQATVSPGVPLVVPSPPPYSLRNSSPL